MSKTRHNLPLNENGPRGKGSLRIQMVWLSGTLLLVCAMACGAEPKRASSTTPPNIQKPDSTLATGVQDLRHQRTRLDTTVWETENEAREYEKSLVALWDQLLEANRAENLAAKFRILGEVEFDQLIVGSPEPAPTLLDHGIEKLQFQAPYRTLGPSDWQAWLAQLEEQGYRMVQSEWHHARFAPANATEPARSEVAVVLHGVNERTEERVIIDGHLDVEWSDQRNSQGNPVAARIDATGLRLLRRVGPPAFEGVQTYEWKQGAKRSRLHPLIVYDLDQDGFDDVLLLGAGRVLRNQEGGGFSDEPLFRYPHALAEAGAVADFNGDSRPDLLATRMEGDVVIYFGDEKGKFSQQPRLTPRLPQPLQGPSSMAVGDLDTDGDLDVWLAQYKPPYLAGQMPTPFYDANDGWPSYLLINDGRGQFDPRTEKSGLADKRYRRTYASTFVDLDGDFDLDLMVISDFSGVDLYENNGSGHFTDANQTLRSDRHLFGMSSAFADYNLDGRLDFFVAGMASTTARRMEAAGLRRDEHPELDAMRMRMAFGNRMYLGTAEGWEEPEFAPQVARSGWSWGTTALDFDNDGDFDLFAANGHESGESTEDYCSTFWRHDIYDANSEPDPALQSLFGQEMHGFVSGKESWDGYQKNHLLMNNSGTSFVNVAFLLGVADEFDSRSAVSSDFDRDGRVDLLVIEDRGEDGQLLHRYRNQLETGHSWIGIELRELGAGDSPVGATVSIHLGDRTLIQPVLVGETIMGQHSTTLHFGLGAAMRVDSVEVRWPNGALQRIQNPEINRYHQVIRSPETSSAKAIPEA